MKDSRDTPSGGGAVPAAAVARLIHDLNNLLTPLTGYAELLAAGALPADRQPPALRAIGTAADDVVERLRVARAELLPSP